MPAFSLIFVKSTGSYKKDNIKRGYINGIKQERKLQTCSNMKQLDAKNESKQGDQDEWTKGGKTHCTTAQLIVTFSRSGVTFISVPSCMKVNISSLLMILNGLP